jgi:hypothetical protein
VMKKSMPERLKAVRQFHRDLEAFVAGTAREQDCLGELAGLLLFQKPPPKCHDRASKRKPLREFYTLFRLRCSAA